MKSTFVPPTGADLSLGAFWFGRVWTKVLRLVRRLRVLLIVIEEALNRKTNKQKNSRGDPGKAIIMSPDFIFLSDLT